MIIPLLTHGAAILVVTSKCLTFYTLTSRDQDLGEGGGVIIGWRPKVVRVRLRWGVYWRCLQLEIWFCSDCANPCVCCRCLQKCNALKKPKTLLCSSSAVDRRSSSSSDNTQGDKHLSHHQMLSVFFRTARVTALWWRCEVWHPDISPALDPLVTHCCYFIIHGCMLVLL